MYEHWVASQADSAVSYTTYAVVRGKFGMLSAETDLFGISESE
jgi:hypothetical protein